MYSPAHHVDGSQPRSWDRRTFLYGKGDDRRKRCARPARPHLPHLSCLPSARGSAPVSHVFMLTVRRRRAPPPTAPLLPPPSLPMSAAAFGRWYLAVCVRVLFVQCLCAALPLEGLAGLWAASGGQESRGVRSFCLPRSALALDLGGTAGAAGTLGHALGAV